MNANMNVHMNDNSVSPFQWAVKQGDLNFAYNPDL